MNKMLSRMSISNAKILNFLGSILINTIFLDVHFSAFSNIVEVWSPITCPVARIIIYVRLIYSEIRIRLCINIYDHYFLLLYLPVFSHLPKFHSQVLSQLALPDSSLAFQPAHFGLYH